MAAIASLRTDSNSREPIEIQAMYQSALSNARWKSNYDTALIYGKGFFKEIEKISFSLLHLFHRMNNHRMIPSDAARITAASQAQLVPFFVQHLGEDSTETVMMRKMVRALEKIERIEQEYGLNIEHYSSMQCYCEAGENYLILNPALLDGEDSVIDSMISHEVGHIYYKHSQKDLALRVLEFATALFVMCTMPVLLIPFSVAAFAVNSFASKHFERQADFWAMDVLQSNEGLSNYWKKAIDEVDLDFVDNRLLAVVTEEQKFEIKKARIPCDFTHPWAVDRYEYCRNYQPRVIS